MNLKPGSMPVTGRREWPPEPSIHLDVLLKVVGETMVAQSMADAPTAWIEDVLYTALNALQEDKP